MTDAHSLPSLARQAAAVLVGLFATWQLVYLPGANLIDFVPRRTGPPLEPISDPFQRRGTFTTIEPLQRAADVSGDILDAWSEASGQEQGWSLFAPGFPPYAVAPAVEFRFEGGATDTVLSPYEPADKLNPAYRLPLVHNRPFNVEAQMMYPVWFVPPPGVLERSTPEEVATLTDDSRQLPNSVRVWRKPIRAYLAWRLKAYAAANLTRPLPTEVILKHRFIPTPKPGEPRGWTCPIAERPFARWRPTEDTLDAFDPLTGQFVPVRATP